MHEYFSYNRIIANLTELSSMSTMGSAGFLLIFAAVNGANVALADDTRSKRSLSLIGVGPCLGALGTLIWQTGNSSPGQFWFLFSMVGTAFFIEIIFRAVTGRTMNLSKAKKKSAFKS